MRLRVIMHQIHVVVLTWIVFGQKQVLNTVSVRTALNAIGVRLLDGNKNLDCSHQLFSKDKVLSGIANCTPLVLFLQSACLYFIRIINLGCKNYSYNNFIVQLINIYIYMVFFDFLFYFIAQFEYNSKIHTKTSVGYSIPSKMFITLKRLFFINLIFGHIYISHYQ